MSPEALDLLAKAASGKAPGLRVITGAWDGAGFRPSESPATVLPASNAAGRLAADSLVWALYDGQRVTVIGPEAPAPPPPAATRGSNANGNWWRHPSGLQICWVSYSGTASTSPYGSLHLAGSQWNYPMPFLDIPTVACGQFRMGTGAAMIGSPLEITRTHVRLTAIDVVARPAGTPTQIQAQAVGLWR